MAKKRRELVTGKHAETYDKEFKQYLNMHEDSKGANKIQYYGDKNKFYLLKKSEKKTIKQIYSKSNKARSMFRPNLFLSKKGSLFELNKDGSVVYREPTTDKKTGRKKWQICLTPNLKEEGGTNLQDYQLTCLVFGTITPLAQEILDQEGLSAMVKLKTTDETKIRTHHNRGVGANPKYTIATTEPGHNALHSDKLFSGDIKEMLEKSATLSKETGDQSYMVIQRNENDKDDREQLHLLTDKDISEEFQHEINKFILEVTLDYYFKAYLTQESNNKGFETMDQYLKDLAKQDNESVKKVWEKQYLIYLEKLDKIISEHLDNEER